MSLRLYLLRHGQTELSREDTFCGSGLDPELELDFEGGGAPVESVRIELLALRSVDEHIHVRTLRLR